MGLHPADYAIFAVALLLSAGVGLFHAWKAKRNQKSSKKAGKSETSEFLMGGRKMPIVPVAVSVLTTFLSGIALLGIPAEVYLHGVLVWIYFMTCTLALLITAIFFLPIFYKFKPTSVYEYFQRRFNSLLLRRLAATLFLINSLFYMAVVMYAPAVALSGVTGAPSWPFILSVGFVCTFYTTLGGLKAVVWTDTLQAVFMYTGVLTLIIKGCIESGGIGKVFEIASNSHRVTSLGFVDPNPAQYFSLWIAIFGGVSFWMSMYGLNQMAMQRYCSLESLRHARTVIGITLPAYIILSSLCCFIGLVALAFFYYCDPVLSKEVHTVDQIVIILVTKTLGAIPGLTGLFIACLFSGTLSTVSSGINSMAAVTWEDFLKQRYASRVSDSRAALISKCLVSVYGILGVALAFTAEPIGGIINAAVNMLGSVAGPLVGLFLLGILVPRANRHGALFGVSVSLIICVILSLGNAITKPYADYRLPTNDSQCIANITGHQLTYAEIHKLHYGDASVFALFRISNYLYPFIGIVLVFLVGVPSSYLIKDTRPELSWDANCGQSLTVFGQRGKLHKSEKVESETEMKLLPVKTTEGNFEITE